MKFIIILLKFIGIYLDNCNIIDNDKLIKMNIPTSIFISLILFCKPVFILYQYIISNNKSLLSTFIFMLIPFCNYIIILNYFRKIYFFKIYTDIVYNKKYYNYLIDKNICIFSVGLTLITLIITYSYEIAGYSTINMANYTNNKYLYIILFIYSIIYNTYSRFIYFFNTIIFLIVFYKHYLDLKIEEKRIKKNIDWDIKNFKINMSIICYNLLFIRSEITKSIKLLEYLYISSTLLGSISLGTIIEHKELNIFLVGSIIIWSFMQIIFMIILSLITNKKEDLQYIINKPKFCFNYLISPVDNNLNFNNIIDNIDNTRRKKYFEDNIKNIKYIDSKNKKNQNVINIINNNGSDDDYDLEDNSNLDNVKNIKSLEYSLFQNSTSLDWMILNKILGDEWATFKFLGVKFENTDGIKKIVCLVAFIVYIVNILMHDINFIF